MAGVGEASAVVGLISLSLQLFDGCVKGFILLSAGQEFGRRGDVLRCQLEWEHYRLNVWATTVGLFKDPPELNVSYPPIVQSTLSNLEQLLTDATKLKKDYGLDLNITDEEILEVQAQKRAFGCLLDKVKPQFVNDTAKVYSRRNSAWKKMKWASADADKLRLLLKDVSYFNEHLHSLLHQQDQRMNRNDGNIVMRSIVAQSPDKFLLDDMIGPLNNVDNAIAASARLKQKGLLLDLFGSHSPYSFGSTTPVSQKTLVSPVRSNISSNIRSKDLPVRGAKCLHRDSRLLSSCKGISSLAVTREVAQYDGNAVIVEWKNVDYALESKLKYRIAKVAVLLAEMKDPAFHSLICSGFLRSKSGRYAYIFEPPDTFSQHFTMKSLEDLFTLPFHRPSLNQRLTIAVALAETVLQLHTAGWLHKGIRSDNVLFFKADMDNWDGNCDIPSAYLSGYEYARVDSPLEATEAPLLQRQSEMYRHPLSLGDERAQSIKRFDMYSLGCVLLELGFWASLQTILLRWIRSGDRNTNLAGGSFASTLTPHDEAEHYLIMRQRQPLLQSTGYGSIRAELEFRMGMAYSMVVMKCLQTGPDPSETVDDEYDDSLNHQEETLAVLRDLLAVM